MTVPGRQEDLHCHRGMYQPFLKCSQNHHHHHHQLSSLSLSSSKHFLDDTIVFTLFVAGTDLPSNEGLAWVPLKSGISVAAWALRSASEIEEKSFNSRSFQVFWIFLFGSGSEKLCLRCLSLGSTFCFFKYWAFSMWRLCRFQILRFSTCTLLHATLSVSVTYT